MASPEPEQLESVANDLNHELRRIVKSPDLILKSALVSITKILKNCGYDCTKLDDAGYAVHHYFAVQSYQNTGIRTKLLECFVSFGCTNGNVNDRNRPNVMEFLNSVDNDGNTLLHLSAKYKRDGLLKDLLLDREVDCIPNKEGQYPIHYLTDIKNERGEKMLKMMINYVKQTKPTIINEIANQEIGIRVYQKAALNGCLPALKILKAENFPFSPASDEKTGFVSILIEECFRIPNDATEANEIRHKQYTDCLQWILEDEELKNTKEVTNYPFPAFEKISKGSLTNEFINILLTKMSQDRFKENILPLFGLDYQKIYQNFIVLASTEVKEREMILEDIDLKLLYQVAVSDEKFFFQLLPNFKLTIENAWSQRERIIFVSAFYQLAVILNWIFFITTNIRHEFDSNETKVADETLELDQPNLGIYTFWRYFTLVTILFLLINEILQMAMDIKGYCKNGYNYSQLFFVACALTGGIVSFDYPEYDKKQWMIYLLGTVASGTYGLVQLHTLPISGIYIHYLLKMTRKSLLVILVLFLPFLVIFTTIFMILVPMESYYSYSSIIKVFAMFLGEFEYDDLVGASKDVVAICMVKISFLMFVIIMIVDLNLLVAIAINITSKMLQQAGDNLLRRKLIQFYEWDSFVKKVIVNLKKSNIIRFLRCSEQSNSNSSPTPNQSNRAENETLIELQTI